VDIADPIDMARHARAGQSWPVDENSAQTTVLAGSTRGHQGHRVSRALLRGQNMSGAFTSLP
jgi:hypothetical protein